MDFMLKKKMMSGSIACAMALNSLLMIPFTTTAAADEKYEFENGVLNAAQLKVGADATTSGYSGDGYVFIENAGDSVTVTFSVDEADKYDVMIGYSAPYGSKQQNVLVDGNMLSTNTEFSSTTFAEAKAGTLELAAGEHTITVESTWGWMNLDYMYVTPNEPVQIDFSCSNKLSDENATAEAQGLMNYLATVYGDYIISGQQEVYGGGRSGDYEWEFEYLYELSGEYPAIRGFDFMNYNSLYGWDDNTTERVIAWTNERNGIATASWHINVPKDMSSYTVGSTVDWSNCTYGTETDFDPSKILTDETSKEYLYFMDAIDLLATELLEVQAAGVPLIFRPFHEAEGNGGEAGGWFWWAKDGSTVYKELWKLLYDKLTNEYGLHNLIWEFNSYTFSTSKNWYPGDDYVDLVGYDKYNGAMNSPNESSLIDTFVKLVNLYSGQGKMVAMAECDTIPSIENMLSDSAYWLYFCPWYESPDSDSGKFLTLFNNAETLTRTYQSEKVITLDELPDWKTYEYTGDEFVPDPTEPTEPPTEYEEPEAGEAIVSKADGYYDIIFDRPVGETAYLIVELPEGVGYANGGLGGNAVVNGEYYWVNIMWEATESGTVKVDMTNPLNVTLGTTEVTDEAIIEAAKQAILEQTNFQGQIWSATDEAGDATSAADVKITGAYVLVEGTTDPTEPDPTEPDPTEPDPTEPDPTEPGATDVVYGDVDLSGDVSITDVIALSKALMSGGLGEAAAANADVDLNQNVDFTDALNIMKFLVKILDSLPV